MNIICLPPTTPTPKISYYMYLKFCTRPFAILCTWKIYLWKTKTFTCTYIFKSPISLRYNLELATFFIVISLRYIYSTYITKALPRWLATLNPEIPKTIYQRRECTRAFLATSALWTFFASLQHFGNSLLFPQNTNAHLEYLKVHMY